MRRSLCLFLLMFGTLFGEPTEVKVGMYVYNLYNIDLRHETFEADFWIWYVHDEIPIDLVKKTWVMNAPEAELVHSVTSTLPDGKTWTAMRWHGFFEQELDLSRYPLLVEDLKIVISTPRTYADQIQFTPDRENSGYFPEMTLSDWSLGGMTIKSEVRPFVSRFGNPKLQGGTRFPFAIGELVLKRNQTRTFVRFFGILYLAVLLLLISYLLPIEELASRMGLVIASIFATIGNNLFVSRDLPPVGVMTFVDKVQILTVCLIILTINLTLFARYFYRIDRRLLQKRIDWASFFVTGVAFIGFNLWIFL